MGKNRFSFDWCYSQNSTINRLAVVSNLGRKIQSVHFCTFRNRTNFTRAETNGFICSFYRKYLFHKSYFQIVPIRSLELFRKNLCQFDFHRTKVFNTSCRTRRAEYENRGLRPQNHLWTLRRPRKVRKSCDL